MAKSSKNHWGAWVIARGEAIGFRSQKELAKAVGCTQDRLSRWAQMANPPRRMLKGFDAKLAAALDTTREILFVQWRKVSPQKKDVLLTESGPIDFTLFDGVIGQLESLGEGSVYPIATWLRMRPDAEVLLERIRTYLSKAPSPKSL